VTTGPATAVQLIAYPAAAGGCVLAGALLASLERIRPAWLEREFRHFVIAFGGGVLLAAVCLVLLPQGIGAVDHPAAVMAWFAAGGLAFFGLERALARRQHEAPQFLATLLDFVPESLALGGALAAGAPGGLLLALLIGLQNLPEGFNSYRELVVLGGNRPRRVLLLMALLIPIGPAFALAGHWLFASSPALLGAVTLFASGGILYLIFQDIAPQARLKNHWFPALGAVGGFGLGLLGELLIGGG